MRIAPSNGNNYHYELSQELHSFARNLEQTSISSSQIESLFHQLNEIAKGLRELAYLYPYAKQQIECDLNQVVSLYGRIISLCQESEVSTIEKEALRLEERIQGGNWKKLAREVKELKKQIDQFCYYNRPSKRGKQSLALARNSIQKAHRILQGKKELQTEDALSNMQMYEDPEQGYELFEIATLFYKGKNKEGKNRIRLLPVDLQDSLRSRLCIDEEPKEIFSDEERSQWIQALLILAHQLNGLPLEADAFTQEEMEQIFAELSELDP